MKVEENLRGLQMHMVLSRDVFKILYVVRITLKDAINVCGRSKGQE